MNLQNLQIAVVFHNTHAVSVQETVLDLSVSELK